MSLAAVAIGLALAVLVLAGGFAYTRWHAERAHRRHPPEGSTLEVDGVRVHHRRAGKGPTVLLLHGLAGFHEDFTYAGLVDDLARDFDVLALDRPGYGHSTRPSAALCDIRRQADWLTGVLDALDVDEAIVLGHSLGGGLALALALRHPERVRGLVLVAPYAYPRTDPEGLVHRLPRLGPVRRGVIATLATPFARLVSPWIVHASFEPAPIPAHYHRLWLDRVLDPDHLDTTVEETRRIDPVLGALAPRYPSLELPVWILTGLEDASVDPDANARRLADELPDAELDTVEDGGHMLPVTEPGRVAAAVRALHARTIERGRETDDGAS